MLALLVLALSAGDPVEHTVLAADAGRGHIVQIGPDGKTQWTYDTRHNVHDLHRLPGGNTLTHTRNDNVVEIDPDGKIVWEYVAEPKPGYDGRVEIHAFQRLPGGLTMVAESGNRRIVEVDSGGKIVHEVPLTVDNPDPHRDTRLARKLDAGNYLVCHEGDGAVREYDPSGKVVWEYKLDLGGRPASGGHGVEGHGTAVYGAVRLPGGNTLIATGNGNRVIEVSPAGAVVWSVGQKELPGITFAWVTTLQVLPGGNVVIGNCHAGPDNPQLVEVTRDKQVVWTFRDFQRLGNSTASAQLLDVAGDVIR